MAEYERRRSTAPRRGTKRNDTAQKRTGVMGVQLAVCVLALAAAVVLRYTGTPFYAAARGQVGAVVNSSVTLSGLNQAFQAFAANLPGMSRASSSKASSSRASSKVSSAASGVSSAGSAASGAVSGTSKTASGASKASSGSSASAASKTSASSGVASKATSKTASSKAVSKAGGAGGQDIVPSANAAFTGAAPVGASFAPVVLSIRPVLPVHGRLTSCFGWRINPITEKLSFHTGIDIAVPEGTPVGAALAGVVEDTGLNAAYGNYVLLNHGNGVETFYGHNSAVTVKKGMSVKAGEQIARSGSTGMSTGPHLHFELRVRGVCVNALWVMTPDEC